MIGSRSLEILWRTARKLGRGSVAGKALPRLLLLTDPARTPDAERLIAVLPPGAGVVYRAFGSKQALSEGRRLANIARRRRLVFLVGADAGLATALRADGVHLPERSAWRARGLKRARPRWIITCAAHSAGAIVRARRAGADAALVSAVFPSASPSAGPPLGPLRFAILCRGRLPIYALGGVGPKTVGRLAHTGAIGVAGVEALFG